MPIAKKEFVLNYAMNRWHLNFKRNVGPTSDSIRLCNPSSLEEWKAYYYTNIKPKSHIVSLGKSLYQHIISDLPIENRFHPDLISSITESDCIDYINMVVIDRTYYGFLKERGRR